MAEKPAYAVNGIILNLEQIRLVEDQIGNWHDHELLLKKIQQKLFGPDNTKIKTGQLQIKMENHIQEIYVVALEGVKKILQPGQSAN